MHLIFPLSLPPLESSASGLFSNGSPATAPGLRRDVVRAGLQRAGLGRARCLERREESANIPEQLADEAYLTKILALARADLANVQTLLAQPPRIEPSDTTAAGHWPSMAALSRPMPSAGQRRWLIKPVHLNLGLDHLVLASDGDLSIPLESASAWCQLLAEALDPDWHIQCCVAQHHVRYFLLDVPEHLEWLPKSSNQAMGRSIDRYLPEGRDARRWRRFLNHAQMLCHDHALNDERQRQAQPTINGLWLEGEVTKAAPNLYRTSMAELQGLKMASVEAMLGVAQTLQPVVLLLDDWIKPTHQGDLEAWRAAWHGLATFSLFVRGSQRSNPQALHWHFFGETGQFSLATTVSDQWRLWRRLKY